MPRVPVDSVELFYDEAGAGEPLVLVHGSWSDHSAWQFVVPALAESFRVVTYDRRYYSQSDRPSVHGSRRGHEDDLGALIERLDCAPAHVAANSFGGSTALGLAARRPALFRSLTVHEPPLLEVVADDPDVEPLMNEVGGHVQSVLEHLEGGDAMAGAREFVEDIALGPGAWDLMPQDIRDLMVANAPAFLDEQRDPAWASIDTRALSEFARPLQLTEGDLSPPWLRRITQKLAGMIEGSQAKTLAGAGHIPQFTNPGDYVASVTGFIRSSR